MKLRQKRKKEDCKKCVRDLRGGVDMLNSRKNPDFVLILMVLILLGIGIVMVFSSSAVWAFYRHKDSFYFLKRQTLWGLIGLSGMIFFMNYDYWHLKRYSKIIILSVIVLLILVLIPGIGVELNYARRWIGVGSFTVQPSEMAKLGMIIYVASSISNKRDKIESIFQGILPFLIVLGIVSALILKQPDLSTAVVICGTVFIMIFAAGARIFHLLGLILTGLPLIMYLIMSEEYRWKRLMSFLNPWSDSLDTGYHIIQSLYALGSGGVLGLGLGKSRQKFFYLPEPQTDFIFSILGEELGFIGGATVIILFMVLLWRGFRIAIKAPDYFGTMLAIGITASIGLQTFINLAVVTASMPVTGIPLPFISFGGSSLIPSMMGIGVLLNISRYIT